MRAHGQNLAHRHFLYDLQDKISFIFLKYGLKKEKEEYVTETGGGP